MGAVFLTWGLSCGPQDAAAPAGDGGAPRLVLLYAPCTVNKDFLSPYAPAAAPTPHLDAFARESVVFRRHHTEAGQSGIAYAALFTGSQADRHGVYRHPVRLADDPLLIAEAFAARGFETFFWNAHRAASARLNYAQGVPPGHVATDALRAGDPRFLRVLERLRDDPSYRAFVVTNFTVTHAPYRLAPLQAFARRHPEALAGIAPEEVARLASLYRRHHHLLALNLPLAVERLALSPEELERLARVVELLYASNVAELDAMFGAVLEAIDTRGLRDESLIAFTADHGEVLYRETAPFQWSHAMQLAPEVLAIPWVLRAPSLGLERLDVDAVTRSIDVFPTLAGLAGVPLPDAAPVEGVDLSPALRGEGPVPALRARSHTTVLLRSVFRRMYEPETREVWERARVLFPEPDPELMWVSIREGDAFYKLVNREADGWRVELFDLAADPRERVNLFDAGNATHREMGEALRAYKGRLVARYAERSSTEASRLLPEAEEAEILRELGYIQ